MFINRARARLLGILFAGGLGLGLYAWLSTGPERPRTIHTVAEREAERQKLMEEWSTGRKTPILSGDSPTVVRRIVTQIGSAVPPDGVAAGKGEVSAGQIDDLSVAVHGLLVAYARGSADDVLNYMADRGEAVDPDAQKRLQKLVAARPGQSAEAVAKLSGPETVRAFNEVCIKQKPGWECVLDRQGETTFWTTTHVPDPKIVGEHFGRQHDNKVFRNIVQHRHQFRPTGMSLTDVLKQHGKVLFADVRLVIKYSDSRFGEPAPHYIRFWYQPQDGKWHPTNLILIPTLDQNYPSLVF